MTVVRADREQHRLHDRRCLRQRVSHPPCLHILSILIFIFYLTYICCSAKTSALQDLQLHFNCGIGQLAHAVHSNGGSVSDQCKALLLDSTFATLTNVNFDSARFLDYLKRSHEVRNELKAQAAALGVDVSSIKGPAEFEYNESEDFLLLEAKLQGVLNRKKRMGDDNAMVVREMAMVTFRQLF